ncbi:MAG: PH domain-containing protein [Deferribacterales bacterium]
MSYIENIVKPDEKVICINRVKVFPLVLPMMFGAFLVLVAFSGFAVVSSWGIGYRGIYAVILFAGLYPFFFTFMHFKNTEIGFTDKRFIVTRGILRRNVVQLDTTEVNLLVAGKGIFGRFMNYGTIAVFASGGLAAVVKGVADPDELVSKLQNFQDYEESPDKGSRILLNGLPL